MGTSAPSWRNANTRYRNCLHFTFFFIQFPFEIIILTDPELIGFTLPSPQIADNLVLGLVVPSFLPVVSPETD